jgi:ankyrin repeat protein
MAAARAGHVEVMALLLSRGARIRSAGTPFLSAVCSGSLAAVEFVLKNGADIRESRQGSNSIEGALCLAASLDNAVTALDIVRMLLASGVDPHVGAPLVESVKRGHDAVTSLLLQTGVDVNAGYKVHNHAQPF